MTIFDDYRKCEEACAVSPSLLWECSGFMAVLRDFGKLSKRCLRCRRRI